MMDIKEKRAWTIIVVFGIVIGYFSLAWAGVVPAEYNVIQHYFGEIEQGDNTTVVTGDDYTVTLVRGIPESPINLSASGTQTFLIEFVASEGDCDDFSFYMDYENSMTNATVTLTSAEINNDWEISADGHYAYWDGQAVLPYDSVALTLTVVGDEFTRSGAIMVICSSNGQTSANTGLIHIL